MKKTTLAVALAAAAALPAAAVELQDKNLSYTYGEISYADRDFGSASVDGFSLEGSFELTDLMYVQGSYSDLSGDFDLSNLMVGVGAAVGLNDMVDGYAQINLINSDNEFDDDTGFGLEFGARALVTNQVEIFGNLQYIDIYDDSDTGFEVGGRYWHMENLGVSLSYTDGDFLGDGITLAARYNF